MSQDRDSILEASERDAKPARFRSIEMDEQLPPELVSFAISEAERDADCVKAFLRGLRLEPPHDWLPADFLLNLASAIRLWRWERSGITIHLQEGLPCATKALGTAIASYIRPDAFSESWHARIWSLTCDRLAWSARELLDVTVVIDDASGDNELVEALARFAWLHRNDRDTKHTEEDTICQQDPRVGGGSSTTATAEARPSRPRLRTSNGPGMVRRPRALGLAEHRPRSKR
jgi:hypothetical protein